MKRGCFLFALLFLALLPFTSAQATADTCGLVDGDITLNQTIEVNGTCFTLNTSNVVIDGAGFSLHSYNWSEVGINVTSYNNITIKGFADIYNFSTGIYFFDVYNSTIYNVSINSTPAVDDNPAGIFIEYGFGNTINASNFTMNNTLVSGTDAILIKGSNQSIVVDSSVHMKGESSGTSANAVLLDSAEPITNVTITRNTFIANLSSSVLFNQVGTGSNRVIDLILTYNNLSSSATSSNSPIAISQIENSVIAHNYVYVDANGGSPMDVSANHSLIFSNQLQHLGAGTIYGLNLDSTSYSNNISNNNISSGSSTSAAGIRIRDGSYNNTFEYNNISSQTNALLLEDGTNNTFVYNTFDTSSFARDVLDLIAGDGNVFIGGEILNGAEKLQIDDATNSTFLNVSFDKTDVAFDAGAVGSFFIEWFVDIFVNSSNVAAVANANVTVYNLSNASVTNNLTGAGGNTGLVVLRERFQNGTDIIMSTPHTVNVTSGAHFFDNVTLNVNDTNGTTFVVTLLDDVTPPTVVSFSLSTLTPDLDEALTGSCSANDTLDPNVSISISGLDTSSPGEKTANCAATDAAGNTANSQIKYTVGSVASGGGGGGGGSSSLGSTSSVSSKGYADVSPGQEGEISFEDVPVSTIGFVATPDADPSRSWIRVEQRDSLPIESPQALVYAFLSISKSSLLVDSDITDITVEFFVERQWLDDVGLEVGDVHLYHNDKDSHWEVLDTTYVNKDDTYAYYTASTPSFSYFVIGGSEKEESSDKRTEEEKAADDAVEVTVGDESDSSDDEVPTYEEVVEEQSSAGWLLTALLLVAIAGFVFYMIGTKGKKGKKHRR